MLASKGIPKPPDAVVVIVPRTKSPLPKKTRLFANAAVGKARAKSANHTMRLILMPPGENSSTYSGDVMSTLRRDVNKIGAQRRWGQNHATRFVSKQWR